MERGDAGGDQAIDNTWLTGPREHWPWAATVRRIQSLPVTQVVREGQGRRRLRLGCAVRLPNDLVV